MEKQGGNSNSNVSRVGKIRYPRTVRTRYPEGFWAGDEKTYSLALRIIVYCFGAFMLTYVYSILMYALLYESVGKNIYLMVPLVILSFLLSLISIKFLVGFGRLKTSMYAATKIPETVKEHEDILVIVEKIASSYEGLYQKRIKEKDGIINTTYTFEKSKLEIHVIWSRKTHATYIVLMLKNNGDKSVYIDFKKKISEALGISQHTATYDMGGYYR